MTHVESARSARSARPVRSAPRRGRAAPGALAALIATLAMPLAISACSAGGATAQPTATPIPQARGTLYISTLNKSLNGGPSAALYALNLADGAQLWSAQLESGEFGAVVPAGGAVYVAAITQPQNSKSGAPAASLEALNATSGAKIWAVARPSTVMTPFAANRDAVFAYAFAVQPGASAPPLTMIEALRASDGAPLWTVPGGVYPGQYIGQDSRALYLLSTSKDQNGQVNGGLVALGVADGKQLWSRALPNISGGGSAPALDAGIIYLNGQNVPTGPTSAPPTSVILAIRASDGSILWQKAPPNILAAGSLAVTGGTVSFAYTQFNGPGSGIMGLRASDGALAWQTPLTNTGQMQLGGGGGVLYGQAAYGGGALWLLTYNARDGKAIYQKQFPNLPIQANSGGIGAAPVVVGGTVFVVAQGEALATGTPTAAGLPPVSVVVALNASDGSLKWDRALTGFAPPQLAVLLS